MQDPIKHHFVPVFYLKRWCGSDKKLCQYSKPYNEIVPERKHPDATGFERNLYSQKGVPKEDEQIVEKQYMQAIDDWAAKALAELEQGNISEDTMYGWSAFLLSLDMRNPHSLDVLKKSIGEIWKEQIITLQNRVLAEHGEEKYEYTKRIFENDPEFSNRHALSVLIKLIGHSDIRQIIHGIVWLVRSVNSPFQFLTSDSPVVMTLTLSEENAYLILPITPQKVFIAAKDKETAEMFELLSDEHLANTVNWIVAGRAKRYVYALDDSMIEFVKKHMGNRQSPNLIERVSRMNVNKSVL